jgi:hypothetical protein
MSTPFVALYDLHGGYDRIYRQGKYQTQRTDNAQGVRVFLEFIADYQPKAIVLGGDMVNGGCVSHWNKAKRRATEGMRLKSEFDIVNTILMEKLEDVLPNGCRKIWIQGNHERFIDDFFMENPGVEGLFSVDDSLQLTKRGYEFYDHGEIARLGKLSFVHGEKIGGKYHANKALEMYQRSIRYGHHHTHQEHTSIGAADAKDIHDAKAIPCMANRNPGYAQNQPNRHVHGFLFGDVLNSGYFSDHVVVMVNNRFILNGKVYGN